MTDAANHQTRPPSLVYRSALSTDHRMPEIEPMSQEPSTLSIVGLSARLWRRRWMIVATMLVAVAATVLIARQLTPKYTADGAVVIANRKLSIPELETLVTPTGDSALVRSEMATMNSRNVFQTVSNKLHLDQLPEFNPRLRTRDNSIWAKLDPRPWISALLHPDVGGPRDEASAIETDVEATLERNLNLINDGRDYVINIKYQSEDPALAAAVVNTLIHTYLEQYIAENVEATVAADHSLAARGDGLRRNMQTAEKAVQDYSNETGLITTAQGTVAAQQVADINTQLALARADRTAAEAHARQAGSGGTASNADVLASPVIQQLRAQESEAARNVADLASRLGPSHPTRRAAEEQLREVRGAIQREIGKVVTSLHGQVRVAQQRESELDNRLTALRKTASGSSDQADHLQRLNDDAQSKRKIYEEFMLRVAQTAKPQDQQQANARPISLALVPVRPSSPRTGLLALLAGFGGLLLAIVGTLIHDQLDHGFESLEEVRRRSGFPGLAAIPLVWQRGRKFLPPAYVIDQPGSPLAETLRAFRAKMRWSAFRPPLKVLLITSVVPGEGKTSFALALARLAARDGCRTLLIECDFRRPVLKDTLSRPTEPGLPIFLEQPQRWRNAVEIDAVSGLDYLAAPQTTPRVSPYLNSEALSSIVADARSDYDLIVIDSPPIMRVPDAMVLARAADAVALVVSWRRTRRRMVQEAMRRLSLHPDLPAGIVLTKVPNRGSDQDLYSGYGR
ncbi:MAG: polysaccharide biosynthesis transport protein [Aliidongia sp.]|jgi:succinoglycan biosynthesis transport protein ExoP|nr:polysaccharide biosynthesis transport protein [Aliidongia sp.]